MRELGIHTFEQIAQLTDPQIGALRNDSESLRLVGWHLWRAECQRDGGKRAASRARVQRGVPLAFADDRHADWHVRLGLVYQRAPENAEDLTQIPGLDVELERSLNSMGIFTLEQLRSMSGEQQESLFVMDGRLRPLRLWFGRLKAECGGLGARRRWRVWEMDEASLLRVSPSFGLVYESRPRQVDRLADLDGLDGVKSAVLKDVGIYQDRQILRLTKPQQIALGKAYPSLRGLDWSRIRLSAARRLGHLPARYLGSRSTIAEPIDGTV